MSEAFHRVSRGTRRSLTCFRGSQGLFRESYGFQGVSRDASRGTRRSEGCFKRVAKSFEEVLEPFKKVLCLSQRTPEDSGVLQRGFMGSQRRFKKVSRVFR